jgi:cytochrome c-type biogenesis protein CcmF
VKQYSNRRAIEALVRIDGGRVYRPALSTYPFATQGIGTPSVRTAVSEDVYLTLVVAPRTDDDAAVIGVTVQPMVAWLWVGGLVMALGTILAAFRSVKSSPSPRRRSLHKTEEEPEEVLV